MTPKWARNDCDVTRGSGLALLCGFVPFNMICDLITVSYVFFWGGFSCKQWSETFWLYDDKSHMVVICNGVCTGFV